MADEDKTEDKAEDTGPVPGQSPGRNMGHPPPKDTHAKKKGGRGGN